MKRPGFAACALACACLLPAIAFAAYNDECRALSLRLATDPGSLKVGELDLLKSCLSDLQRSVVLGEPPAAKSELPACAAQAADACPVCPAAPACPASSSAEASAPATPAPPATRAKPSRERSRDDDRRLKPYLPTY